MKKWREEERRGKLKGSGKNGTGSRGPTSNRRRWESKVRVKSNYFTVRPKVDQRAGLLSLPHLGNFRRTATFTTSALPPKHSPEGDTAAQQCRTSS